MPATSARISRHCSRRAGLRSARQSASTLRNGSTRLRDAATRQEGCAMKTWLNVGEGAEYAGVSRDTIYTACERKELRHASRRRQAFDSAEARMDRRLAGTARARRPGARNTPGMAARCSVASDSEPKEGGTNDGSVQDLHAQGTCSRSLRARMVGQLSRQAGEPGEMDEPRDRVQGGSGQRTRRTDEPRSGTAPSTSEGSIRRATTRR